MFGTDEGWPSRWLPTPKGWLYMMLGGVALVAAALGAKVSSQVLRPTNASVAALLKARLPKTLVTKVD